MPTSRAQDAAAAIKAAREGVEKADAAYRRGGSLHALNRANRKLADCHDALYVADAGLIPEH